MQRALVTSLGITGMAVGLAVGATGLLSWVVTPSPNSASMAAKLTSVATTPPERIKSEREYLDIILGRNIFDPTSIGLGPSPTAEALGVRLVGTMVAEPAMYSAAFLIHDDSKGSGAVGYSLGHKLGGAEIIAIEWLSVTVRHASGGQEVLTPR